MHNHKKHHTFLHFLKLLLLYLPSLFWILLIFGFDTPYIAVLTILAALIHECGHIGYLLSNKSNDPKLKFHISGFRITSRKTNSYLSDAHLYFAGPAANFVTAAVTRPFVHSYGDYAFMFLTINLATAISNLLPIKGYDGYGAIRSLLHHCDAKEAFFVSLDTVSLIFTTFISFLSLYVMARIGDGYWTAGLFIISLIKEASESLKKHFRSFREF